MNGENIMDENKQKKRAELDGEILASITMYVFVVVVLLSLVGLWYKLYWIGWVFAR